VESFLRPTGTGAGLGVALSLGSSTVSMAQMAAVICHMQQLNGVSGRQWMPADVQRVGVPGAGECKLREASSQRRGRCRWQHLGARMPPHWHCWPQMPA
jgi:hypothetical protein